MPNTYVHVLMYNYGTSNHVSRECCFSIQNENVYASIFSKLITVLFHTRTGRKYFICFQHVQGNVKVGEGNLLRSLDNTIHAVTSISLYKIT